MDVATSAVGALPADSRARVSRRRLARPAVPAWLLAEALLVPIAVVYLIGIIVNLPNELAPDTWLALLSGREIVAHGLPTHDSLMIWSQGRDWVDQQWLAQLWMYGAFALGGLKLVLLAHTATVFAAFALALSFARRRGATTRSVLWIALPSAFLFLSSWTVRTQSLVYPLFVVVLWILVSDARHPSRRVFLTLPVLVLWANLHGTVVLAAALVALRGLDVAWDRRAERPLRNWVPRVVALVAGPFACVLASPYGLDLVGYYRHLLVNPAFGRFVSEWQPSAPSIATAPFYLLAFAGLWLLGRNGSRLSRFEKAALLMTLVLALTAVRSMVWFTYTALVILPVALDSSLKPNTRAASFRRLNVVLATAPLAALVVLAAAVFAKPESWFESRYPAGAADTLARVAATDPGARVFASERYADWLLFRDPNLRGRVAFDARFELLTAAQVRRIYEFHARIGEWRRSAAAYRLVVLDGSDDRKLVAPLLAARRGARVTYFSSGLKVIDRGPSRPGVGG